MSFLELHFDVVDTIFTVDPQKKRWDGYPMRLTDHLMDVIAHRAWGTVDDSTGDWVWNGESPSLMSMDDVEMNYATYLEEECEGDKAKYHRLLEAFTDCGNPGEMLSLEIAPILASLLLPPEVIGSEAAQVAGLGSDHAQLLPGFFVLMSELCESGRNFSVTLRGFGSEVKLAAQELATLCNGTHPFKEHCRATRGKMQCDPALYGTFCRDRQGVSLSMGSLDPVRSHASKDQDLVMVMQAMRGAPCAQGVAQTLAYQDCGSWWSKHREPEHGKIFPLRNYDEEVHAIFFDANAMCQVDSRNEQGAHVPFSEVSGVHVVAVDPLKAMGNERYLVDMLEQCEQRYSQSLPDRAPSTTFGLTEVMD